MISMEEYNNKEYSTHGFGNLKDINGEDVWKAILTNGFSKFKEQISNISNHNI